MASRLQANLLFNKQLATYISAYKTNKHPLCQRQGVLALYAGRLTVTALVIVLLLMQAGCYRKHPLKKEIDIKQQLAALLLSDTFPRNFTLMDQAVLYGVPELDNDTSADVDVKRALTLAIYNIGAGQNDSAIALIERLQGKRRFADNENEKIFIVKGLAWHRKAEITNCRKGFQTSSCIYPFTEQTIYKDTNAIMQAIACYNRALLINNKSYHAMWLLNIAYSTIGYKYAKASPFYIDLTKYNVKDTVVSFKNEVLFSDDFSFLGGNCIEDLDNDGYTDFFITSYNLRDNVQLFYGNKDGSVIHYTHTAGLDGIVGGGQVLTTDYNNDGLLDLYIVRGGWMEEAGIQPNSLLRNNGDRTFTDVTVQAGLFSMHPCHSACWADVNNDGLVDVFVANENWAADANANYYCELFINNGNGTFKEVAKACGINVNEYVKGVVAGDIDNDGLTDLYLSNYGTPNKLFRNTGIGVNGLPKFEDIAKSAGVQEPLFSFPCMFFDFNNDGWTDILVMGYSMDNVELASEYVDAVEPRYTPRLYINNHNNTFTETHNQAGLNRSILAMGLSFADVDNDGFLDVYAGTGYGDLRSVWPNVMLHNKQGKVFEDITMTARVGFLQKGHAVSFGDIDHDGDNDMFADLGGFLTDDKFRNALLINEGTTNNWVGLKLQGTKANKAAIGARVKVVYLEGGEEKMLFRDICNGGSYGNNTLEQVIGLGRATAIKRIEVTWPGNITPQVVQNLQPGKFYKVTEQEKNAKLVERKYVVLKKENEKVVCR